MKERGITLIALVITIIVLLILATVSVVTLTGENGIISKAKEAKELTEQANIKEQIQMAIIGSYGEYGGLDYEALKENLNKIEGIAGVPDPITDSSFPLTLELNDDFEIAIQSTGTVEVESMDLTGKYTVTYHGNGQEGNANDVIGSVPTKQRVILGNNATISNTTPTRAGYNFKGWWTSPTLSAGEQPYQAGSSQNLTSSLSDNNVDLYAIWEIQTLTFTGDGLMEGGILTVERPVPVTGGTMSTSTMMVTCPTDCMISVEFNYSGTGSISGALIVNGTQMGNISDDKEFSCLRGVNTIQVASGGGGGGTHTCKITSIVHSITGEQYKFEKGDS